MKMMTVLLIPEALVHRFQEKDFLVSVEGWSRKRRLHWRNDRLILEIAMKSCMCSTCVKRFESLLFSLKERDVQYEVGSWEGDCSIKFVSTDGFDEKELCAYLSERIGLRVSELEEIQIKQPEA